MKCKNCATEISIATTDDVDHQLITCPDCNTVFPTTNYNNKLVSFTPSSRSLPAKMSIEVLNDELVITSHWRGVVRLGLFAICSFLLTFGLFFSEVTTPEFLFNPLTWIVSGIAYYGLVGLVNTIVVRVDPAHLSVRQGPLLPRRHIEIDQSQIDQLYIKKHVQRGNKSTTITYQLHLVHKNGLHQKIVSNLDTAEQALFLEQEIERYLGLEDQTVSGEHEIAVVGNFANWRTFAAANNLHYTYGKLLTAHRVHGLYQGWQVELVIVEPRLAFAPHTRLTMTLADEQQQAHLLPKQLALETVAALFATPLQSTPTVEGQVDVADQGQTFTYEEAEVVTEVTYLQIVFDTLVGLSQAYPHIIALGGAVILVLHPIALDKKHPARAVAIQLIKDIAPTTEHLTPSEASSFLCPDCLVRSAPHKVDLGWSTVMYYGCRQCHQSQNFLTVQTIVAVLDRQAEPESIQADQTLTVNWLARPDLFDFDAVKILDATDEEVERFAVQIGNDTDPVRKSSYKQLLCTVSPDCNLSENTMRILKQMFGQVEVR